MRIGVDVSEFVLSIDRCLLLVVYIFAPVRPNTMPQTAV